MFDVDNFDMAGAIQESQNYKLVRYGGWLYLFPAEIGFSAFNAKTFAALDPLERQSVLSISPLGRVTRNRFGKTTTN